MPLSEHEERILAEIERQLAAEDPNFVARARKTGTKNSSARLRWAIVGFIVGLVSLLGLTFHFLFGVAGIALMLVSAIVGVAAVRDQQTQRNSSSSV